MHSLLPNKNKMKMEVVYPKKTRLKSQPSYDNAVQRDLYMSNR